MATSVPTPAIARVSRIWNVKILTLTSDVEVYVYADDVIYIDQLKILQHIQLANSPVRLIRTQ